ncbi:hypothetical protein [Gilvibacter sediminis]|uniref:hypothetical protein n=1 Tax=Gilvibacter sediminis TaxID=379071 RepID=UPI0023501A64|nr:hypothetical protein [Gilvibacter sediminis]MDC7998947.1 hypothetical protein [Gilvibacter sediminis]
MKPQKTYLKGKSVFIISLLVIVITVLTVYFSGLHYHRSLTTNLYMSLGIIATALVLFMTYGLYFGVGLLDNFPKFKHFQRGDILGTTTPDIDLPDIEVGEGIGGIIASIVFWILMTIAIVVLLIVLEAIFWFSLFVLLAMLYWVFFRALRLVFSKSKETQGDLGISAVYALGYTVLYVGWIFAVVYLVELFR